MNIFTIENAAVSYSEKTLFQNVTLGIDENDKIGLIGVNGTGKSTFLKAIAGIITLDEGKIMKGRNVTVRYLPQNPNFTDDLSVIEQIFESSDPATAAIRDYEMASRLLEICPDDKNLQTKQHDALDRITALDAWELEIQAKKILARLGVASIEKKVSELSGGLRKRVALAEALIKQSDLLILDEPTNHLDTDTIDWLEEYLSTRKGALIMVTHDRYFLDRVTTRTIELDKGNLYSYDGNFETFLQLKAMRMESERKTSQKARSLYLKELEWIRTGARARTTKQKARIQRFDQLSESLSYSQDENLEISVPFTRLGKKVIQTHSLAASYQNKMLFDDLNLLIKPDSRIGILGPNGSGKSTLLKILSGKLAPYSGEVETGETVKIGYYMQESEELDPDMRALDYIKETAEMVHTADGHIITASQMLERFLFDSTLQHTFIRNLSGGERRRLYLAKTLMLSPNVLLLDEPTNDLDIQTLEVLEEYLESFKGALIVVSHDRYFLDKTVDSLLIFEDGKVLEKNFSYIEYRELRKEKQHETTLAKETKQVERKRQLKLTYAQQREYETIEDEISTLEDRLMDIESSLMDSSQGYSALEELLGKKDETESMLLEKMERWEELQKLVEEIEKSRG